LNEFLNLRFLFNTSGSGKTRLLLEGLWRNWGYYFTSHTIPDCIGSEDLEKTLYSIRMLDNLSYLSEEETDNDALVAEKQELVVRRLLLPLYVRTLVFRLYLGCALRRHRQLTPEHKSKWLLLQLAPSRLLDSFDIFATYVREFENTSHAFLNSAIGEERDKIYGLLRSEEPGLFCVIDGAQVPTELLLDCFASQTEPSTLQPTIHQIISLWTPFFPQLILSGTGIPTKCVENMIQYAGMRQSAQEVMMTEIGAFESQKQHQAYLEKYLPLDYLSPRKREYLLYRIAYWLHGRYVARNDSKL
jgi:hypothetical protein